MSEQRDWMHIYAARPNMHGHIRKTMFWWEDDCECDLCDGTVDVAVIVTELPCGSVHICRECMEHMIRQLELANAPADQGD